MERQQGAGRGGGRGTRQRAAAHHANHVGTQVPEEHDVGGQVPQALPRQAHHHAGANLQGWGTSWRGHRVGWEGAQRRGAAFPASNDAKTGH